MTVTVVVAAEAPTVTTLVAYDVAYTVTDDAGAVVVATEVS